MLPNSFVNKVCVLGGGGAGRLGKECFLTTLLRFVNMGGGGRMFPDKFILYII